ncbi:U-box domain-containing protein 7-like [Corylus avellana]|uniref:U-box domain-containing protein 7-like n=1 Tax=Corylus avellana TaxID=13451 RepID=UPI001E22C901|nr:U-box domain-containing protein 7-like [Corylus avellana]XP_059452470.1 U-box domain-containing protein 7-like [Corylus avellana]
MEELVIENLFNGEREAQVEAARDLSKLSSKQRHKLAERGVTAPLILMLQSQDYDAIEASLFALLSLAFGSERNKIRIMRSGAIPVLLSLLQCQNEALIELTIAAMLILSSCTANKLAIASHGAIQLLVEFLNASDNNVSSSSISLQAKLDAIATLHNLSTCHQIIPSIVSSGLLFSLLQLIHSSEKSSELVEKIMGLLENVVSLSENALCETAGTGGAIRALVETIEEGSPQCKEHAAGILLLICQSCRERYRGIILREGVMPGLLQLSVDGTWRAKTVARELLLLLRDCPSYGSRNKQSKNELIQQIMQEIDAGENVEGATLRLVEEMIARLST